jgi:acetolactate synthase-1/3 small subunit
MTAPTHRSGQSGVPQGAERRYTLIILVEDRPGSVDRVVGLMRRRRANMQTLVLGRGGAANLVRVTVTVNDSEVGVDHLIEQLRKVVDVRQVVHLTDEQAVARELALIKVNSSAAAFNAIIELGHLYGAYVVDVTGETVTLEVAGSEEKINKLVGALQEYGIREIARSGRVALSRGATNI